MILANTLVLVVEDNEANLDVITRRLQRRGYATEFARNGKEALDVARRVKPDLILMDLEMPVASGFDAIKEIRADTMLMRLPVIALTAHATHELRDACRDAGFDAFVSKPIEFELLLGTIATALGETERRDTERVLIVDDHMDNRAILARRLGQRGFEVIETDRGGHALEIIADAPPHLVLLDYMMPELSGLDVLRQLRRTTEAATLPVIMITARSDEQSVVECLRAGANDYVTKPVAFQVLMARIDAQLERRRALAALTELNAELEDRVAARTRELKQSNDALREARDRLEQSNEAKSLFLATMSHELRTPLNAILGLSDIMVRESYGAVQPARYSDYVKEIWRSGAYLHSIVEAILDNAALLKATTEFKREPVDMGAALRECVSMVESGSADAHIALVGDPDSDEATFLGDAGRLKQAVTNILANAVKFSPPGETVELELFQFPERVEIEVRDRGPGIPEDRVANVTLPFFQVHDLGDKKKEGVGLGLSIADSIVRKHGGSLVFTNRKAGGLSVRITLPRTASAVGRSPAAE